jgi:uncharacterized protein YqjF (DUF2071 family)
MNHPRSLTEALSPDSPHRITRPVMLQGWYDLTALHWPYEPSDVQERLPEGFLVDPPGQRGVWFLSLDVTRLLPALIARATYHLPYCWAEMTIDRDGDGEGATRRYVSRRRWPRSEASSLVAVRVGRPLEATAVSALDHFLTARWALGSRFGRRLLWAEVDHPRWPLHAAEVIQWDETLVRAAGLPPPVGDPIARWYPGVDVRIRRPRRIRPKSAT